MFFNIIKRLCFLLIIPIQIIAQPLNTEKIEDKKYKKQDAFVRKMLLQDTTDILDSALPLPYSLQYTKTYSSIKRQESTQDSLFDKIMKEINPTTTTSDYFKLKDIYTIKDYEILAKKIHELEKEKYMLHSQVILLERKKIGWLINPKRSGYYVGFGFMHGYYANVGCMLGFRTPENPNINLSHLSLGCGSVIKLGYLRYFYNNLGLKAEYFGIYGSTPHKKESRFYEYYGLRLSFLHDIPVFNGNNYFGFFAGLGVGGGYVFSNLKKSNLENNVSLNLHIGASWSYTKHHRIEIEHIFTQPFIIDSKKYIFNPSSIVSYSWVF